MSEKLPYCCDKLRHADIIRNTPRFETPNEPTQFSSASQDFKLHDGYHFRVILSDHDSHARVADSRLTPDKIVSQCQSLSLRGAS